MQLGADAAVIAVGDFGQLFVVGKALFVEQGFFKPAFAHGNIANDNHTAAARGNAADPLKIFLLGHTEGGRGKDNAVFQLQTTVIDRTVNCFVHDVGLLPRLCSAKPIIVIFPPAAGLP